MKGQNVYIGNSSCNGIYHYKLINGSLIAFGTIGDLDKCTYICKRGNNIYGVCEKDDGEIFSYNVESGAIKTVKTNGSGPCHISASEDGKYLFVSDYKDGYKHIYITNENGEIDKKILCERIDEKLSHEHFMKMHNDYLYAVDIGKGCIEIFSIDNGMKLQAKYDFDNGVEPRHLCFFDENIFAITEKSCKLYSLRIEKENIKIIDEISLLQDNVEILNDYTGCAIKVSDDGKYVYATIRGHNSVSVFKNANGSLKLIQNISSYGELPWDIEIDNNGEYILVANAASDEVCTYKRNKYNGKLKFYCKCSMNSPSCILVD